MAFEKRVVKDSTDIKVTIEDWKDELDKGNIMILCLDTYYITYNNDVTSHYGKYYDSGVGSGHFLIVKGYKYDRDGNFYFEVYDPDSRTLSYADGTPMGLDRYYLDSEVLQATTVWSNRYLVIFNPKTAGSILNAT